MPVRVRGRYHQRIDETEIAEADWADRHWKTIVHAYSAAPHFDAYAPAFERAYRDVAGERLLSVVNRHLLEAVMRELGVATPLGWSTDYTAEGAKTERLVELCKAAGATEYVSGPSARAYIDEARFHEAGIALSYVDYDGYPEYPQIHGEFEHTVSIIDLIFNTGPAAPSFMKTFDAAATAA